MNRREFLEAVTAAAVVPAFARQGAPPTSGALPYSTFTSIFVHSRPATSRISMAQA